MSKDWSSTLATAQRLISNFGREITLAKLDRTPDVTNEPWKGDVAPPPIDTTTQRTAYGVAVGRLRSMGEDFLQGLDNVIVVAGDFDARGYEVVLDGASRWRVVKTETVAPGSTKIIHFLGVVQ